MNRIDNNWRNSLRVLIMCTHHIVHHFMNAYFVCYVTISRTYVCILQSGCRKCLLMLEISRMINPNLLTVNCEHLKINVCPTFSIKILLTIILMIKLILRCSKCNSSILTLLKGFEI